MNSDSPEEFARSRWARAEDREELKVARTWFLFARKLRKPRVAWRLNYQRVGHMDFPEISLSTSGITLLADRKAIELAISVGLNLGAQTIACATSIGSRLSA